MEGIFLYRNRPITTEDVSFIRGVIASNPNEGRCALSRRICEAWNWVQRNGHLKEMICRGLLLRLERQGYIELPPRKSTPKNPFVERKSPQAVEVDQSPIEGPLRQLLPISLQQVRRSGFDRLFNGLIAQYHYLGYSQPVGEHLKYVAFSHNRPIACLAWSSAPWHIGCRDRFIGWSADVRQNNLHLLAYNSRFLILPWVSVPHLASHLLAKCTRVISSDWQRLYHHPIYFLETFVDTERFKGICYRAANWIFLGNTTGRGKFDQTGRPNRSIKDVYGYPLVRDFRARLCHG
jgi:hypothetical protein